MVTDDPVEAETAAAAGQQVVLIVPEAAGRGRAQPGRVALLIGDISDPAVRAAADEMDAELFRRGMSPPLSFTPPPVRS